MTAPGVYREEAVLAPSARPRSGVPAFIGFAEPRAALGGLPLAPSALAADGLATWPEAIEAWPRFGALFASAPGYLAEAVRCFFANGGERCYVVPLRPAAAAPSAVRAALAALAELDEVDLVCAPDLVWRPGASAADPVSADDAARLLALQTAICQHCEALGDRFALLDSLPALAVGDAQGGGVLRQRAALASGMAALYWPWIRSSARVGAAVPPCGHVAGVVARSDRDAGPHRAPANLPLEAAVDLQAAATADELGRLSTAGVNALRAVPGRGIRIWGARTLSTDPAWRHIGVRRLTIAIERWSRDALVEYAFAPNDAALWRRLQLAIGVRLEQLFRDGALAGSTPADAYYVRCDAQTTPPEEREAGRVIAEVGVAPTVPNEFIVVQIVRDATGAAAAPA